MVFLLEKINIFFVVFMGEEKRRIWKKQ